MTPEQQIEFFHVLVPVLLLIILLLVCILFFKQIDDMFGGLISKFLDWVPKAAPYIFKIFPYLSKKWLTWQQGVVLSKEIKKATGLNVPVEIEFVEAKKARTQKKGHKLLVMYNPSENADENFANVVLAVAESYIPNSKTILDPNLQKCVKLAFAQDIVESHGGSSRARDFAAKHFLKGKVNQLTTNPYFHHIEPIKDKRLFSRLYVHTLSVFGSKFDVQANRIQLRATVDKITHKISEVSKSFMDVEVQGLIRPSDPEFEDGFEFFFRESGLCVNLMFIRSFNNFSREDISKYVHKTRMLLNKGMQVNYLIGGGFSVRQIGSKDYIKRVEFAKKVARELKKFPELELASESEQPYVYVGVEYPIYIAIFVRKDGH